MFQNCDCKDVSDNEIRYVDECVGKTDLLNDSIKQYKSRVEILATKKQAVKTSKIDKIKEFVNIDTITKKQAIDTLIVEVEKRDSIMVYDSIIDLNKDKIINDCEQKNEIALEEIKKAQDDNQVLLSENKRLKKRFRVLKIAGVGIMLVCVGLML